MGQSNITLPRFVDPKIWGGPHRDGSVGAQINWNWGPGPLRAWAGEYGLERGLTTVLRVEGGVNVYAETNEQHAFRHAFTAGTQYLKSYLEDSYRFRGHGVSEESVQNSVADRVLWWGFANEAYVPNQHLRSTLSDYHNNYEGILLAREALQIYGPNITNAQFADFVAQKVRDSAAMPPGQGRLVMENSLDPRTSGDGVLENFDRDRLPPSDSWGLVPGFRSLVPPLVREAFGDYQNRPRCFIAGTPILMADGTEKPIEEIKAGDMVMSFDPDAEDGLGPAVPQQVKRTFVNTTRVLIDFHGLKVTPGHSFLADKGEWMKIADILRQDRAYVRDENDRGVPYRARTNCPIGSDDDVVFQTVFMDQKMGVVRYAHVRGCKTFALQRVPNAPVIMFEPITVIELLTHIGATWTPDGKVTSADGKPMRGLQWPEGKNPFDVGGDTGAIVALDGQPFTPDWISNIPRDGEETRAVMNAGGGPDDRLLITPYGARTMRVENGQSLFNPAPPRQALPPMRPMVVASNPAPPRPPMNRAQRRKRAALSRVT